MKLGECLWLCDESIQAEVVAFLRGFPFDVASAQECGLLGKSDADVLRTSVALGRVVLTHDADFGMLAVAQGTPIVGIVHVRPGHISATFTIETMTALLDAAIDVVPPFLIVAQRSEESVKIRVRLLG